MADDARDDKPLGRKRDHEQRSANTADGGYTFARRALVASVIAVAIAALATFLWYSVYVLLLIFAGVLLAILLRALAELVADHTRLSHRWSLAVVLVALVALFVGFVWIAAPQLGEQLGDLGRKLPQAYGNLRDHLSKSQAGRLVVSQLPATQLASPPATQPAAPSSTQPTTQSSPQAGSAQAAPSPASGGGGGGAGGDMLRRVTGFLANIFDVLAALVVVVFTALFIAFDPRLYVRGALRLLPIPYRDRGGEVLGAVGYTLKWWLIGQAVSMVVIGVATWLGLRLLGVPLAGVLGALAALFNFIPNFGPLISMVPAALLATMDSPATGLWVIVLFIVLQNLEGNLLTPLIQRKAVSLPPALAIVSQILMTTLAGGIGLMLAVPLAAAVHVAVKMLYVEDALGDRIDNPADKPNPPEEVREAKAEAAELDGRRDAVHE